MQMRPFEGLRVDSARGGAYILPGGKKDIADDTEIKKSIPPLSLASTLPTLETLVPL
jgi:hypothetical protein